MLYGRAGHNEHHDMVAGEASNNDRRTPVAEVKRSALPGFAVPGYT